MGEYKNLRESKRSQENPTESERIRVPKSNRIRGNKKGYKRMWKNMREHEISDRIEDNLKWQNPRESGRIRETPRESRRIRENMERYERIWNNPRESERIGENSGESEKFERIRKNLKEYKKM